MVTAIAQQLEMCGMCSQKEAISVLEHSEARCRFCPAAVFSLSMDGGGGRGSVLMCSS